MEAFCTAFHSKNRNISIVNHNLNSYSKFNKELTTHVQVLGDLREKLKPIYLFQCSIMVDFGCDLIDILEQRFI